MSLFPELDEDDIVYAMGKFANMTSTGKTFEKKIAEHLRNKYPNNAIREQVKAGKHIGSNKKNYVVDILFNHDTLVSAKFQGTGGTAEQKIMFEMNTLQKLCDKDGYKKAYLVYDGAGLTMTEQYKSDEMKEYVRAPSVIFVSFDEFKEMNIA
jgi:hypothetical protein